MTPPSTVLVDRRNLATELPGIIEAMRSATMVGLDCETEDDARHEGLNVLCKYDPETRHKKRGKLIFDMRRIVMCGFSVYPENHDVAYYFNLNHADVENRLRWDEVKCVLDARPANAFWLCHNAPFELTVFASCYAYQLSDVVCTMQLSVTAFGDDNYDLAEFQAANLGDLQQHIQPLLRGAIETMPMDLEPDEDGGQRKKFSRSVDDIIGKICAKESTASTNYNGYVDELAYGHGLKGLVLKMFGYKMGTFEETLGGEPHMGRLTGEQVAEYGAEDAYWVVPLFHKLMAHVAATSPDALETFFSQENPMIYVFSDIWSEGMKVNFSAIEERRVVERAEFARILREMKAAIRDLLPFDPEPEPELLKREAWYEKNFDKYRSKIATWALSPDHADDYEQCLQVSSPVSNAWAEERKEKRKKSDFSITHYMPARVFLYDLLRAKMQFDKGKVASDGEARGKVQDWLRANDRPTKVVEAMTAMAGVEQRMKLYLTPYLLLTDPETQRMYPTVSSMLNTRRMAASNPNPMQLAKRGESTYVRGFFLPDYDDHVIVSLDWSAFELVIIGELSKDPEFHKAFGQVPHEDLHGGAAADILRVEPHLEFMNEDVFKSLRQFEKAENFMDNYGVTNVGRLFTNLKGEAMPPKGAHKYWRTEIGKGANFNYWYSGFLTTVGERMGWSLQRTGEATEFYRNRFSVAEQWRLGTITQGEINGYVQLPDGHRRFRYEATDEWMLWFKSKWPNVQELNPIVHEIARRINKRAKNQLVNAMVQGTNAFVMKRSILRLRQRLKDMGWGPREARFMIPIHDEKVWSVHRSLVAEFITIAREIMSDHLDIFPTLKLDATPAVGLTFEPWDAKKAPYGQVELFEPPAEIVGEKLAGQRLDADGIRAVVDYLQPTRLAA